MEGLTEMNWLFYILGATGLLVYVVIRLVWRRKTCEDVLGPFLKEHGCELVKVEVPPWYETGPFPKVAIRAGAVQVEAMGMDLTHFEYRIVTFKDKSGQERRRWVRLLLNPFGAQDIIWEPGTTELPNKETFPFSKAGRG
jgi:hypothetical protein